MIVDMTQKLMGLKGDALKDENGEEIVLRTIITNALGVPLESDKGMSGDDKAKIWAVAVAVQKDKVDLTIDELSLIKKRVGEVFPQFVVGPAFLILNGTGRSVD